MSNQINRQVWLKRRPSGIPQADDFGIRTVSLPIVADGQILVRNQYLSADPAMRGWILDASNSSPQVAVGEVMRASAVGEVIESRSADYRRGDRVVGLFGWQDYAAVDSTKVTRCVDESDLPLSLSLGVLGLNGLTAYFGLLDIGQPRSGETVVVSTAAGAVGSCVGQIARLRGCRTLGITGGSQKAALCRDFYRYDAAIDYKASADLDAAIKEACPNGVDVYFDNTSGPISDAVLRHLNRGARIAICGTASVTRWDPWPVGPRPARQLLVARASMRGFLIADFRSRYAEGIEALATWIRRGDLVYREEILIGMEQAPASIGMLYSGANLGKLIIRIDKDT